MKPGVIDFCEVESWFAIPWQALIISSEPPLRVGKENAIWFMQFLLFFLFPFCRKHAGWLVFQLFSCPPNRKNQTNVRPRKHNKPPCYGTNAAAAYTISSWTKKREKKCAVMYNKKRVVSIDKSRCSSALTAVTRWMLTHIEAASEAINAGSHGWVTAAPATSTSSLVGI